MNHPVILPNNDSDADNRLIHIVITYIKEREMPLMFALHLLENNLRNKSLLKCPNFNNHIKSISNEVE